MAVVREGQRIQPGRGAGIDLNSETVQHARSAFRACGAGVQQVGVPVVVEIVVRKRLAEIEERASGVCGEHKVRVLSEDIERGGGVVELVHVPGHRVSSGYLPGDDIDQDHGTGR